MLFLQRKVSKEDPYIEVVLGTLKSSGDLIQVPMVDLASPDTANSFQAKLGSSGNFLIFSFKYGCIYLFVYLIEC